jgi:DNA polymerase-1
VVEGLDLIRDGAALARFLESVSGAPFLALDTETSGLDPWSDRLLLVQVGTADRQALLDVQALDAAAVAQVFRSDRTIVMHNSTFDLKMLARAYGPAIQLEKARFADTQTAERLLRNGRRTDVVMGGFALKTLAERYTGMDLDKSIRQGFYGVQSVAELSEAELSYAKRDVEATWKVFAEQLPQLRQEGLLKTLAIEGAAAYAFAELELAGAPIDAEAWKGLLDAAKTHSADARRKLDREFWTVADRDLFGGTTINYSSDEEVLAALGKLGVPVTTMRRDALVATGHSAAIAVAEWREHQKIVSTYGDAFLAHMHPKTKRFHPRFKSVGTITGRASCAEPNLQNIPSGSEFRACFRAPAGRKLITADYAGAELRIIAEASRDPTFIRALSKGEDLHSVVATKLFKKPVSKEVNADLRARAKAINFGLAYGMGAASLGEQLGLSLADAEALLDAYFLELPRVQAYLDASARQALRRGVAETMAGRRYWFTDMRREGKDEQSLRRVARNMPIQGTSADIIKIAMARIVTAFAERKLDASLVNMVHDELVVECAETSAAEVRDVVVAEMVSAGAEFVTRVPVEVDAKIGDSWEK